MVKKIFFFCVFFSLLKAEAGDTLTRAQVFNFCTGDTFDYWSSGISWHLDREANSMTSYNTTNFARCIIAKIYYSKDSAVKFIVRNWVRPLPAGFDTVTLTNLSGYEVYMDTLGCDTIGGHCFITLDSTALYNGRITDTLEAYNCGGQNFNLSVYAAGLGLVSFSSSTDVFGADVASSFEMIYFARGGETWGTPYYFFPAGLRQSQSNKNKVSVSPTVNDGTFTVDINDSTLLPVTISVCDIRAKEVKKVILDNLSSKVSIDYTGPGSYLWSAYSNGIIIQQGEMVVR